MKKIIFIILLLVAGPHVSFAADEPTSNARDASSGTASDGTSAPSPVSEPAAGASTPRVTPTPTNPAPSPDNSSAPAPAKKPVEIKVIELTDPVPPQGSVKKTADAPPPKQANSTVLAIVVTVALGAAAWFLSKSFSKANTEKKEEKDDSRCRDIKSLLEQKMKEMEESAKSWPENKLKELIINKTLTAEQKDLLAKYEAAKEKYENLKKAVELLQGKYDLCMLKLPSNEDLVLVRASESDIDTLLQIEKAVSGNKTYSPMLEKNEWLEQFNKKTMIYLVKRGDVVLGEVSYEDKGGGHFYIDGLVVKPEFQNKGIGRKVMKKILAELKEFKRIDLVTHPENAGAVKLYESFGFKIESRKENYFGDGEPRIVLSLEKK